MILGGAERRRPFRGMAGTTPWRVKVSLGVFSLREPVPSPGSRLRRGDAATSSLDRRSFSEDGKSEAHALRENALSVNRAKPLTSDQKTHNQKVEKVGADAGGERRRVVSEMIVQQAGDPAAGAHAAAAEQQKHRDSP